jgi:glucosamine--fructose-6-phosphate aminotransferase (isomerizing)
MSLINEINQQPLVLQSLLENQRASIEKIAAQIRERNPRYVFLAARGTSDNAGRYANYLWGAYNQLPLALAAPSLFTFYEQPPSLKDALVVGISQSGQSPDIVSVLEEGRKQGSMTLAITNEPDSPLAQAADALIDLQTGEEKAVAATKTYTAELMAVAMLSAALSRYETRWESLARVPQWAAQVLENQEAMAAMVQRYTYMRQCVVLGRGFNYATAFEWSLKLKELTYTVAEPYSSADFLHGPIAMLERNFPVLVVAPQGKVYANLWEVLQSLRKDHMAELVVISNQSEALQLANTPIALPVDLPEWLSPIVAIIPAQLFAYQLTSARGFDTEAPRSIHKVTETH